MWGDGRKRRTCIDEDDAVGGVGGVGDDEGAAALAHVQAGVGLRQGGISLTWTAGSQKAVITTV